MRPSESEYEVKFVLPLHRSETALNLMRASFLPDPKHPHGMVHSIYYDTPEWQYLEEKVDSDYLKTKVRLRWYQAVKINELIDPDYFFEIKRKVGSTRQKTRTHLDSLAFDPADVALESPELMNLPLLVQCEIHDIDAHVEPVFQLSYERFRFYDPMTRTRLSLDRGITVPRSNWSMLPHFDRRPLDVAVLETKGTSPMGLPPSLYPLVGLGCRKTSFSKYLACRDKLTQTIR